MNDSELILFAAKACGLKVGYSDNFGDFSVGEPYQRGEYRWNPLDDDGDALRLAVKLKMDIAISIGVQVSWWCADKSLQWVNEPIEDYRRAIVRAAAEIGKAMP